MALLFLILFSSFAETEVPNCRLANAAVEERIARTAKREEAVEYCQFRSYDTIDDFDGDHRDDFVVLFHVEIAGGNHVIDFIHVYASTSQTREPIEVRLGQRGDWIADQVTAGPNRRMVVSTLEYRYGDALCCPSGKGEIVFQLRGGKLVQIERKTNVPAK